MQSQYSYISFFSGREGWEFMQGVRGTSLPVFWQICYLHLHGEMTNSDLPVWHDEENSQVLQHADKSAHSNTVLQPKNGRKTNHKSP